MRYLHSIFIIFFLSSCSTAVSSIEYFEKVDLKNSSFSPTEKEIAFLKYRVSLDGDVELVKQFLKNIQNIEIVDKNSLYIDYKISTKIEKKVFKNRTIIFGKLLIWNSKLNLLEEVIPISNNQIPPNSLHSFFSPVRGYILEKRVNRDDEVIFRINIGKNRGLKKGSLLNIYGLKKNIGHLSKKTRSVSYKIGVATVSEVEDNWAWIYLNNTKYVDKVFKGDRVTIKNSEFSEYLEDGTLFMKTNKKILENNLRF